MGQESPALSFGVILDDIECDNIFELLERYEDDAPEYNYEQAIPILGYLIAVGGSGGDHDEPYLDSVAIGEIPNLPGYEPAAERWAQFSQWAREQGVNLPPGQVFYTETETA